MAIEEATTATVIATPTTRALLLSLSLSLSLPLSLPLSLLGLLRAVQTRVFN